MAYVTWLNFAYQWSASSHSFIFQSSRLSGDFINERISGQSWEVVSSDFHQLCSLNLEHAMTSMKVLLYSRWGYFLQIDGQQRIRGVRTRDDYCGKRTMRPEIWLCDCTIRYNYLIIEFNGEVYKPAVLSVPNNWPILLISNWKCLLLFQI